MIKIIHFKTSKIPNIKPCVACIGNFDASHKGHQALYKKTISIAKKNHLKSYVITFKNDPNTVLFNEKPIYSLKTRISLYESFGLDGVIIIDNNKSFFNINAIDFIRNYLLKLNINYLVTGFDFKFGKNQEGNNNLLRKYFCNLIIEKPIKYKNKKISTNRIKKCIYIGNLKEANIMLGYEFKK